MRRLGVAPERCIHTHPIKRDSDIRTALAFGVTHFVVDNADELRKFVRYRNRAALLIRLAFRSDAVCDLSRKFGCEPEAVPGCSRSRRSCASRSWACRSTPDRRRPIRRCTCGAIDVCGDFMRRARERAGTSCRSSTSAAGSRPIT